MSEIECEAHKMEDDYKTSIMKSPQLVIKIVVEFQEEEMDKKGKLELTWVGKNDEKELEPRILVEDKEKSYGEQNTGNMLIHVCS